MTNATPSLVHLRRQSGAALMVVLILLMVMTLIAIASMKGTVFEERMSAAQYDRVITFQSTEAALREAEALIEGNTAFPETGCTNGLCAEEEDLAGASAAIWQDTSVPWRAVTADVNVTNNGVAIANAPEYVIESMGLAPNWPGCEREMPVSPNCLSPNFRITARSTATDRARVLLQASYAARGD